MLSISVSWSEPWSMTWLSLIFTFVEEVAVLLASVERVPAMNPGGACTDPVGPTSPLNFAFTAAIMMTRRDFSTTLSRLDPFVAMLMAVSTVSAGTTAKTINESRSGSPSWRQKDLLVPSVYPCPLCRISQAGPTC